MINTQKIEALSEDIKEEISEAGLKAEAIKRVEYCLDNILSDIETIEDEFKHIEGRETIHYKATNLLDEQIMETLELCLKSGRFHLILETLEALSKRLGTDKLIPA